MLQNMVVEFLANISTFSIVIAAKTRRFFLIIYFFVPL